jgi:hypothetical protein
LKAGRIDYGACVFVRSHRNYTADRETIVMARPKKRVPTLRQRADDGRWVAYWDGKYYQIGPKESPKSEIERRYAELILRIQVNASNIAPVANPGEMSFVSLVRHYLQSDESPRSKGSRERFALLGSLVDECFPRRMMAEAYDAEAHRAFKAWLLAQRAGAGPGGVGQDRWCRDSINSMLGMVRRVLRYGQSRKLCRGETVAEVLNVRGVRIGDGRESEDVQPADWCDVKAAVKLLLPLTRAMALLQVHSAARAGELCVMRPADVDRTGPVWVFTPRTHKGTWRGKDREILLGKRCQAVLAPLLEGLKESDYVFSPRRTMGMLLEKRAAERTTKRYPSHLAHNKRRREAAAKRQKVSEPKELYTTGGFRQSLERACTAAGVPVFTPHQLRHLALTRIREKHGIDAARAVGGHSLASVTERYSREVDRSTAARVAAGMG